MSTLTWVLLILAFVVIGGVLLFNFIQERKSAKPITKGGTDAGNVKSASTATGSTSATTVSTVTSTESSPTLSESHFVGNRIAQSSKSEPSLGVLTPYTSAEFAAEPGQITDFDAVPVVNEPIESGATLSGVPASVQPASPLPASSANEVAPKLPASVLSDDFDYLLEFALPSLQSGERLISLTAAHRRAGGKPVAFDGLLSTGQWVMLQAGELYVALRAGLLLANRHGPLNAMEFSDFGNFSQTLADQLDCEITLADMPRVLSRAREVDRRCADLDAQLGISIQTPEVTSPATLATVASEYGLSERGAGRFAKLDDTGGTLFTLSFGEQADKLALLLDVPRASAQHRPWQTMLHCAEQIAQRLNGQLVDDTGKALPEGIWGQIEEQLRQRYWALEAAGIEPGSARALRLFN
jgi:ZipA, C-terminal FtsZ-binding domain